MPIRFAGTSPSREDQSPSAAVRRGSSGTVSDDNKGVANPSDDQDDSQGIHHNVTSGMVANLIGDREGGSRQHEMGQVLMPPSVNMK